ncbi:MAG TPA: hypothetical protein VFA56_08800 [Gaiellaceae bacterium]|nr:hypothetical protein [Gaiellaceae bacterium]
MVETRKRMAVVVLAAVAAAVLAAAAGASTGTTSDVAAATSKFRNLAVAKKAGYGILRDKKGIACIAMDSMPGMGAMGVHYVKSAYVGDGKLEKNEPEALVYAPTNGKLRLAALEYVVLKSAWQAHHASAPSLFGHTFALTPAGNRFGLPAFYSLHVWLFAKNPAGTFTMWNPNVSCR